jgi:hypothetical protein
MRPLNAAVLIALLTTTQCKTVEGQRAESTSATCAADTVACLARILERHGGLEHFRQRHYAQYTATDDYSFPFTLFKPWPNKAAAWTKKADRANADQVMMFPGSDILLDVDAAGGWASASGYAHDAGKFGRLTQFFLSIPLRMADSGARIVNVHDSTWFRLLLHGRLFHGGHGH